MEFLEQDPNKSWKFKSVVNSKVSLIGLMKKYGLELEERHTGENFTHRTYCPFHKGKNGGRERTPSMFISQKTNSFFCFACGVSGDPIHFVSLMDGTPPLIALQKLAKDIGLIKKDGKWDELQLNALNEIDYSFDPLKTIEPYILETSTIIREYIKKFVGLENFEKELKWVERIGKQLDIYLNRIGYEDWEDAVKIRDKLSKKIKSRIKAGEK
jgi:hypothetical protein